MKEKRNKTTLNTIRCGHCGNKTLMEIISEGSYTKDILFDSDACYGVWEDYLVKVLVCPNCLNFNIMEYSEERNTGSVSFIDYALDQLKPKYLYPQNKNFADTSSKAQDIRDTYREAVTCFQAELYTSSVVMCRKTMEMLCIYFNIKQPYTLDGKLSKMREQEIIDNKLYEWANALKYFGNEAVHSSTKFAKEDAQDILDFTYALVEYCIDFDYKFEKLLERRGKSKSSESDINNLTEDIINSLLQSLNANEVSIRYYSASILSQRNIELDKVIPVLLSLTDKNKFSPNAIHCLKSIGIKAIPELIKALESTNNSHNIRAAAASVLGDIGSKEHDVIKSLIKALKDTHEDVQYKATIALEKLGVAAVSTVVQNL